MRGWMLGAVLLGCGWVAGAEPVREESAREKPNVVVIFCDDLGYGDVGCFGAKGYKTPALDRMAVEGMKFTDFYVAQAVCSASRAGLLTGCLPNRIGIQGALGPNAKIGISAEETTLGELFANRGYATAMYGKWHLGDAPKFLPTRHGFGDWYGLPYSNDMWPKHPTAKNFPPLPLFDRESILEHDPDQSLLTQAYTDRAVKFIEQNQSKPFFLYLAHTMPHVPIFASEKFRGTTERGLYGDVISEIDASVGRVIETLERLKLSEKTYVLFTSDNGPWLPYGTHAGSTGGLREGKGTSFEGGVRVPCLLRRPGTVPAGTVCRTPAMTIDVFPTCAELLGVPAAAPERPIDGKSILPLWLGTPGAGSPHEAYAFYWGGALEAVRGGRWKLHFPHDFRKQTPPGGTDGRPAGQGTGRIGKSLFDLETDPNETTDVAAEHPEVVAALERFAERYRAELGDTLTKRTGSALRPAGKLEATK